MLTHTYSRGFLSKRGNVSGYLVHNQELVRFPKGLLIMGDRMHVIGKSSGGRGDGGGGEGDWLISLV